MLTGRENRQINTGLPHHLHQKSSASFVVTVLVNKHLWPPQHPTGRSCPQISSAHTGDSQQKSPGSRQCKCAGAVSRRRLWAPVEATYDLPVGLRRLQQGELLCPACGQPTKPSCVRKILNLHQRCVWKDTKS